MNERLLKGKLPAFIRPVNLHIDREYFNRVYFNDEKKRRSLLPEETDAEG